MFIVSTFNASLDVWNISYNRTVHVHYNICGTGLSVTLYNMTVLLTYLFAGHIENIFGT